MKTTATTEKAPYRVEIIRERANPKYKAGTMAAKYPTIQSREHLFFDTIAEASAWYLASDLTDNAKGKVTYVHLSGLSRTGARYTQWEAFNELAPSGKAETGVATVDVTPDTTELTAAFSRATELEAKIARDAYLAEARINDGNRAYNLGVALAEAQDEERLRRLHVLIGRFFDVVSSRNTHRR